MTISPKLYTCAKLAEHWSCSERHIRNMVDKGLSFEEVAQYLGHSSTKISFKVYARFSPDYLRRAADALE